MSIIAAVTLFSSLLKRVDEVCGLGTGLPCGLLQKFPKSVQVL